MSLAMHNEQAQSMRLTLLAQLLRNPLRFFGTLWTYFVVHDEAIGRWQKGMDPLSSSIQGSQRHRIDSTADCKTYIKQSVVVQVWAECHIPSDALPSTPHSSGSIPRRTPVNSSSLTGKLFAELYRLGFTPWRKTPAEEHFLNLRTLLLHINSAVASNAPAMCRRRE
jgi:hypothetical protein